MGRRLRDGGSDAKFREARNFGLVRIADDERDAGKRGEVFGRALGIAAGGDNSRGGVFAMDRANRATRLRIGCGGDRASVHHDDVGRRSDGRDMEAARAQLTLDGGGVGLRGAATELFDEKCGHKDRRTAVQRFLL